MERSGMSTTDTIKNGTKHSRMSFAILFSANLFSDYFLFRRTFTRPVGLASAAYMQPSGGLPQVEGCAVAVNGQLLLIPITFWSVTPPLVANHFVMCWAFL